MWWDVDYAYKVGSSAAVIWPARSKPGVEPRHPSEDLGVSAPRVEGIAWGWSHRAAITSRSWQWKDNGSVPSGSAWPDGLVLIEPSLFIIFLDVVTQFYGSESAVRLSFLILFFLYQPPKMRWHISWQGKKNGLLLR